MGAGVVDRPDVVIIEADQADRLAEVLDEHGVADLQVVEISDGYERHGYVLPDAGRRGAGWLPRSSIQPLRIRVGSTGCGWLAGPRATQPSARPKRDPCSGQVTVRSAMVPRLRSPPAWPQMLSRAYSLPRLRYRMTCRPSTSTAVGESSGTSASGSARVHRRGPVAQATRLTITPLVNTRCPPRWAA